MASYNIPMNPVVNGSVNYQRFTSEYFSGCNMLLYFGDIVIDEIVAIQFEIQEKVAPIYGYSSYNYDKMVHGSRLITGQFKINFVESGYLQGVMKSIFEQNNGSRASLFNGDIAIGRATEKIRIENLSSKAFIDKIKNATSAEIQEEAELYERAIWSQNASGTNTERSVLERQQFVPSKNKQSFNRVFNNNDVGFDILIHYGPGFESDATSMGVNTSIETLNDVHITGCSKVIDPSGQPIQELYSFMARDWNAPLANKYVPEPEENE